MDAFQSRFSAMLREAIATKMAENSALLWTTVATDYPSYMERVGFLRGLKFAMGAADSIEESLSRPEGKPTSAKAMQRSYET